MTMTAHSLAIAAEALLRAHLSVLPARRQGDDKRVALREWKPYQQRLPTEVEVQAWFANGHTALCLVGGTVSGNLEMIDFDVAGEAYPPWCALVRETMPDLLEKVVIETTPSGGRHVIYRCDQPVSHNMKLAQRRVDTPNGDPVIIAGKRYIPRQDAAGRWFVPVTLIETRGEGGIFLCAPSEGYTLTQGRLEELPVLTLEERETLLTAAWSLNEMPPSPEPTAKVADPHDGLRPGDDYAQRGDVRAVLRGHGWTPVRSGANGNEYWRRPGRENGWSATLREGAFYVFSSNAAPLEPDKAYGPFAVYALLEHGGDFTAAARALRAAGYGEAPTVTIETVEGDPPAPSRPDDPGPLPEALLRVPGFVGEVMDFSLETAPYPNPVIAFGGALALLSFLSGRRVRDAGDNRTNLYLLGLAHSAAGKDWPRKLNTRIVHHIGLSECLGERFASGEGMQDALFQTPGMLFQTDEIDGILQSINKAKDARHEAIMSTLLTMYSSANSVFPMRRKAGKETPGVIDQPSLVIFGTAIPNHYYQALSERMLTNGFFARMIILESGPRPVGQEPSIRDVPTRVLETAKWWADFRPGPGNLDDWHPVPIVVEHSDDARKALIETRAQAEAEYSAAESRSDPVGTTVWGRVSEHVRKLALLYAVSGSHRTPRIELDAVRWASAFVMHQTRRMLFMAAQHVADSEFDALIKRAVSFLRQWHEKNGPDALMPAWELRRRLKQRPGDFRDVVTELEERQIARFNSVPSGTKPKSGYRLL